MVIKLEDDGHKMFLIDPTELDTTHMDPVYKIFLEHLKEDGKSYVFEMNHGLTTFVKYEREDELSKESKLNTRMSSSSVLLEGIEDCVTNRRSRRTRSRPKSDQVACLVPNNQTECCSVDDSRQIFLGRGDSVTKRWMSRSCSKSDQVASLVPNSGTECSSLDDFDQKFPRLLKIEGSLLSLEHEHDVSVKYEKERGVGVSVTQEAVKETSTASERLAADSTRTSCSKSEQVDGVSFVPSSYSESSLVDESYQRFLSCLNIEGSSISMECEPVIAVTHETEKETAVPGTHGEQKEILTSSESLAVQSNKKCSKSDQVASLSFVPNIHSECSLLDDSYQNFLSLLKIENGSMRLETSPGVFVTIEQEKKTSSSSKFSFRENIKSRSKLDQAADFSFIPNSHSECSLLDESHQKFLSLLKIEGSSMILDYETGVSVTYERENETSDSITREEKETSFSSETLANESTRTCSKSDKVSGLSFVSDKCSESALVDESYLKFSSLRKIKGNLMRLDHESGVLVTYEQEKETGVCVTCEEEKEISIASENLALPYGSSQVHEDDDSSKLSHDRYDASTYGRKLSVILNKPYDHTEYEELLRKANDHKPLIREKHLRSMSKSYATNEDGLSYLDYYPDFAEKMKPADCYDRLILLRGFFFWLENLCHQGAFKPWVSLNPSYEINVPVTVS